MYKGVFVGLSTVDIVYRIERCPDADSKVVAQSQTVLVGGPATNAAITFSHLGGSATLVTTIGCHPLSQMIVRELQQSSTSYVDLNPEFEEVPALSSILVTANGKRAVVSANATRIATRAADASPGVLDGASIMLVDGHFMQSCIAWARRARAQRIKVVLDGGSWKPGTDQLLESVDVAICSADFRPPGCQNEDDVIRFFGSYGIRQMAITRGEKPIRYVIDDTRGEIQVKRVLVADTLGAGDIFHGAFCSYYNGKNTFLLALIKAAEIASESVKYEGTRKWMAYINADSSTPARNLP
jgi:sugar/nucleoside kinase (ribokinase family)